MTTAATPPLEGELIPAFTLPRAGGGEVRVRGYRGRRSLVIFFLHGTGCAPCRDLLAAALPRYGDYAYADTELLAIVPATAEEAEEVRAALALPFAVLGDDDGAVARRYGIAGAAALLITDRFGVPVLWQPADAGHDLPGQDAILREVEYLAHTCSAGSPPVRWSARP